MEPTRQTYSYDIILIKSSFTPKDEETDYVYSVRLYDEFKDIPERRLFQDSFPSRPLGEFVASPCDLINSLNNRGVCVTLLENEAVLGCGNVKLSSNLLRKLAENSFSIEEKIVVDLVRGKKTVAAVQLKIKFSSTDPNLDTRLLPFGCYDVCKPVDKSINPKDVIFTLGRSNTGAVTTCITDERLMSHAGAPFSCIHANPSAEKEECSCFIKGVKPPPQLDQSKERERKLLKKLLVDLRVDEVHVPTPPSGHDKSKRCRCNRKFRTSSDSSSMHYVDDWSEAGNQEQDQESNDNISPANCNVGLTSHQLRELHRVRKRALGVCPDVKSPDLKQTSYKPPLLCPVCKANITWLPKVSACPYCGYKRFEMERSEEPFDETATAQEVLQNHFVQTRLDASDNSRSRPGLDDQSCNCSSDRVCTRCRIRELCEQMFNMDAKMKMQDQLQKDSDRSDKKLKSKSSSASQRRSQLLKIFKEMRDHYAKDKRAALTKEEEKLRDECEATCHKLCKNKRKRRRTSRALKQALYDLENDYPVKKRKLRKRAKRRVYSKRYTFIERKDKIRAINRHQGCGYGTGRVPCHMGWMWNKSELARHRRWKPGAIMKPIRQLMAYFLKDYPVDVINPTRKNCGKRRITKPKNPEEPLIQHPTLHITKNHDEYVITLRPLKDPKTLPLAANPYANMKPVVFRITKDPVAAGKRSIKMALLERGHPACTCRQPIGSCFCRSHVDQRIVEEDIKFMCKQRGWSNCTDEFVFSDLSDSDSDNELDFGVTPPAGIIKPERLVKPDRVNCETQYNENDWAMPTMYPHPASALVQYGGCVLGERHGRFPWILGKGYVHSEPKPAKQRNRPKSKKGKRLPGGMDKDDSFYAEDVLPIVPSWHRSNLSSKVFYSGPFRSH